jgi:hypothetical protein
MREAAGEDRGRDIFIKILSDKQHTDKWLGFAIDKLKGHNNRKNAGYKEGMDYVQDAISKVLSLEIIPEWGPDDTDKYVCGFIRKEISYELRGAPKIVSLSDWDDIDEERDEGERCEKKLTAENLIAEFDDPFEKKVEKISPADQLKLSYELLEKKSAEWLIVFDERAKGHPNREIAKYLNKDIRWVENMWKRIVRHLRKNVPEMDNIIFLAQDNYVKMIA